MRKGGRSHRAECESPPSWARPPEPTGALRRGLGRRHPQFSRMELPETTTTVPSLRAATPELGTEETRLQLVPFQFSIPTVPAAQMSLAEMAAIALRLRLALRFGSGLETWLQLVPSQCSTRGIHPKFEGLTHPTAQTLDGESAATPKRSGPPTRASGKVVRLQLVPSKW